MISKKDFTEFVNSFNKLPGEFTREEIYEIGVKHRELPLALRDWGFVADLVGWPGTKESLRGFIKRKLSEEDKLPRNENILSDKNVEEITETDLIDAKQQLLNKRQQVRDEWTAYRKLLRENSRVETFIDELKNEVKNVKPLISKVCDVKHSSNTEMVLCFSDLHLGADFENSYNKYNPDIAIERVNKLISNVVNYCKVFKVGKLHFLNMGDLISGVIHTTLRLENSLDLVKQITTASEIVCNMLNELQKYVPEITYRSVTDNHSRVMANKIENIEAENFNRLIDYYIQARLEKTNVKFPDDNLSIEVGNFTLNNGKIVMFSHGHEDKKTSVFQDFVGLSRQVPDYIFMAHFHNAAEHTFQNCKVYINGSIVGTDNYAYSKRLFSKASQKAVIFDGNNVIDINIELQ